VYSLCAVGRILQSSQTRGAHGEAVFLGYYALVVGEIVLSGDNILRSLAVFTGLSGGILVCPRGLSLFLLLGC
jgi:hypothetical protein